MGAWLLAPATASALTEASQFRHCAGVPVSPPILVINCGSSSLEFAVLADGKGADGEITGQSGLLCLVVPTNEELMIARETALLTT